MSIFTQRLFAEQVTLRLEACVIKSRTPFLANFRCHICGDSVNNKTKRRGYIIERKSIAVHCHNCNYHEPLATYLKDYHNDLFRQYWIEILKDRGTYRNYQDVPDETSVKPQIEGTWEGLQPLHKLAKDHPAVEYVKSRQIPVDKYDRMYYIDKFYRYINNNVPLKFSHDLESKYDHGRLVFPLISTDHKLVGVIGRSLDPNAKLRYITIKFDPNVNKIYGLDHLDLREHAYVTEGAIDSLFLPNALAFAGTDGSLDGVFAGKNQFTIVLDNQPRNSEVVSKYSKYITQGYNICLWPDNIKSKDINQMILDGIAVPDVVSIVRDNTFTGLNASIRFSKWKKV